MKCSVCSKEIKYEAGVQYIVISMHEMMYSEHCICPEETKREVVCSGCFMKEKEARDGRPD